MNARRSFFKNLIGASAVAAATASTALAKPEPVREIPRQKQLDPYGFGHKGWSIRWTGYKEDMGSEVITGQWIAKFIGYYTKPPSPTIHEVAAVTGGAIGTYHTGMQFNCCVYESSPFLVSSSPDEEKMRQQMVTLDRLLKYLTENPLADWQNCAYCGPIEHREENIKKYGYGY